MLLWADIDNAPHVLVLHPIIKWLTGAGLRVEITARDHGQTLPLLQLLGLPYTVTGKHPGKLMYRKILSFFSRSLNLVLFAGRRRFAAVFSHGTRAVYLPAKLLGIPLVVLTDYEHAALPKLFGKWPVLVLVPEVMPDEALLGRGIRSAALRKYPGLKEELYVYDFKPDPSPLERLGFDLKKVIVLIRPPASMAHYHVKESDDLFLDVLQYFHRKQDIQVVLLPRTSDQASSIRRYLELHKSPNIRIPDEVYYGPNLIYYSDLVISGGGTMNREAACIGVPVYTIFKGPMGSVDKDLIEKGRLKVLESAAMLDLVRFEKIPKPDLSEKRHVREKIVRFIGDAILSVTSSSNSTADTGNRD